MLIVFVWFVLCIAVGICFVLCGWVLLVPSLVCELMLGVVWCYSVMWLIVLRMVCCFYCCFIA